MFAVLWVADFSWGVHKAVQFPLNCEYRTVVFISSTSLSETGMS